MQLCGKSPARLGRGLRQPRPSHQASLQMLRAASGGCWLLSRVKDWSPERCNGERQLWGVDQEGQETNTEMDVSVLLQTRLQRGSLPQHPRGWRACDCISGSGLPDSQRRLLLLHGNLLDKGQRVFPEERARPSLCLPPCLCSFSFGLQLDPAQNSQASPSSRLVPLRYQPLQGGPAGLHPPSLGNLPMAGGLRCHLCEMTPKIPSPVQPFFLNSRLLDSVATQMSDKYGKPNKSKATS